MLYGLASFMAWLAWRVFPYRPRVVRENLTLAFPDWDDAAIKRVMRDYYRGFADVLVEIVKSASIEPAELRRRVRLLNPNVPRELIERGKPLLLVAAHQCNWEWLLLSLSLELGYPLDAAYKPLVDSWAEREMLKIRSRFGGRLIPAQNLLPEILKRRNELRVIAMVADQEPKNSERRHWTRFLNRDTAFFVGPEEIARATRYPVVFVAMRRTARGHYEIEFQPLSFGGENLPPGELTERYAQRVEAQIRAAPADWPWSHKRWRLKKSLYSGG